MVKFSYREQNGGREVMAKYERPEYTVLLSEYPFELREYRDFYVVEYDNAADPDVDSGFGTLFRYISKDNQADRKISMTVPVIQELSEDRMKMAFVVPKAEWEDIPQPNSPSLTVKKFDSGLLRSSNTAAIRMIAKNRTCWRSWRSGCRRKSTSLLRIICWHPSTHRLCRLCSGITKSWYES